MAYKQFEKIINEAKIKMETYRLLNYSSIWKIRINSKIVLFLAFQNIEKIVLSHVIL